MIRKISLCFGLLCLSIFASAQLIINEVCSSNDLNYFDEFNDHPDWIELYNDGTQAIQLSDYFITEDVDIPFDWQLPNILLQPNEFYLILASGRGLENNRQHTSFKIKRKGEALYLFKNDKTLIDEILVPENQTDWSYGRIEQGSEWGFFDNPSPLESNTSSNHIEQTEIPVFSVLEQFHDQPILLEITTNTPNAKIHFTTNGTEPTDNSPIYQAPIEVSKTTSVRAIAFAPNQVDSKVESSTYFISESSILPIVALSVDSLLLFDQDSGMLVMGPDASPNYPFWGANFWKDIELPVHFEYFSKNGEFLTEFESGCKVHGGRSSRTKPQRSLRFSAKPIYGIDKFEHPFFEDKPEVKSFETIVLRNSSGDFNNTHFRDGFLSQYMIDEGLDLDIMSYQPTNVYINGKYWGVMNLREKSDETFVAANYDVELDKLDVLEEDTLIILGDRVQFSEDVSLVRSSDLSDGKVFEEVSKRFDLNSFADYMISETYLNNTDWGHNNLKLWRAKQPDAKWRYLLFDLDVTMRRYSWTGAMTEVFIQKMTEYTDEENDHLYVLRQLFKNEQFHNYFINRYCDLLNTVFRPEIFSKAIQEHADKMEPAIQKQFERWDCASCSDFETWENTFVPQMIGYSIEKAPLSRKELQTYFSLENEILLDLKVAPAGAGTIQINTVKPNELPWNGYYFKGIPVKLKVIPNTGYSFLKWQGMHHDINSIIPEISYSFDSDDEITAIFELTDGSQNSSLVFPNPVDDLVRFKFNLERASDVIFEIFSIDGKLVERYESTQFQQGRNDYELNVSNLSKGQYHLRIISESVIETLRFQKF